MVNSNVFDYTCLTIHPLSADNICVTSNGELPISKYNLSDVKIPLTYGICNGDTLLKYLSGEIINLEFKSNDTSFTYELSSGDIGNECFKELGYAFGCLSAHIPPLSSEFILNDCKNLCEVTSAVNSVSGSVCVSIDIDGTIIEGESLPITIYEDKLPFDLRLDNESFNMVNQFQFFDRSNKLTINNRQVSNDRDGIAFLEYLEAIIGNGCDIDSLGTKIFSKIANFEDNISNVDRSNIDALYSTSEKLNFPIEDFGLTYPNELKRIMDIISIPYKELFGERNCWNRYFNENIHCGDEEFTNLGDLLNCSATQVSAGQKLVYQDLATEKLDLIEVTPLEDGTTLFPLSAMETGCLKQPLCECYCFFEYLSGSPNECIENYIDYDSLKNTIDKCSHNNWIANDCSKVEQLLLYTIMKGLCLK